MGIFVYASTATGKSTCGKKYKNVIDMESTIYKYLNNSEEKEAIKGNKDRKLNPDWPSNYFKKLEEVKDKYDYILISDEVCNVFLLKNNYEYFTECFKLRTKNLLCSCRFCDVYSRNCNNGQWGCSGNGNLR